MKKKSFASNRYMAQAAGDPILQAGICAFQAPSA
jgi:hypothetical protein